MGEPSASSSPVVSTPVEQILFHVRLIDPWRTPPPSATPDPLQARYSFFGLELELRGNIHADHAADAQSCVLDFTSAGRKTRRAKLLAMAEPFELVVRSKMPLDAASDLQKPLLHILVPVQTGNSLAHINKIHFLRHCTTGSDVFQQLESVLDGVSVARPFELTFLRHNHAQAAAKIRPFAARADVQQAQVAQLEKLQTEEATWPVERRKRKQFVLQQMDFHREHYLYDHVGSQLQELHEEIMGAGQWHAYEFEKALWYYHAPTNELFAEHPMRNNAKTRLLIGCVQLRTRMAARRLQHGAKRFLRITRLAAAAADTLLERICDETWPTSWNGAWEATTTDAAIERLLGIVCDGVWNASMTAAWEATVTRVYVYHLQANKTSAAKAKKLWEKWSRPGVIKAEPLEPPQIDEAVERFLDKICDEMIDASLSRAWEVTVADKVVGELKANTTSSAKAKKLWEKWSRPGFVKAESGETPRVDEAVDKLLEKICGEVVDTLLKKAWEATVAEEIVGKLKATTTKAAKAKKLWEKWSRPGVIKGDPVEPPQIDEAVERLLDSACDEILRSSLDAAWELNLTGEYVGLLKANASSAAKTKGLWEKWSRPGVIKSDPTPRAPLVEPFGAMSESKAAPPPPTAALSKFHAPRTPPLESTTELTRVVATAIEPPLEAETELLGPLYRPEVDDAKPKHTRVAEEHGDADDGDDDDDDEDDDDDTRNWRSRLRLLKIHKRMHASKKYKHKATQFPPHAVLSTHSGVVAGGSCFEPPLVDRGASLLLDLAVDGPVGNSIASSLRDASDAPAWRRDGSFRSFHTFFTASSSPRNHQREIPRIISSRQPRRKDRPAAAVKYAPSTMAAASPPKATALPSLSVASTAHPPLGATQFNAQNDGFSAHNEVAVKTSASPPKKLPYIRRRRP